MLSLLMSYCCATPAEGVEGSKGLLIDYVKFANFLNWKDKLPLAADQKGNLVHCINQNVSFFELFV